MAPLRFRPDGTFTLAQFTDLHWQNGEAADQATRTLLEHVLDAERPDVAVFTGDLIYGPACTDPAGALRAAVAPCVARGVPWALVFGNHDDERALDRHALLHAALACPGCLAEAGPSGLTGVGNYRLPVAGAQDAAPAASLCFLDSGAYAPERIGGYAWIAHDQIAWYRATASVTVPALVFFHIPLPEYGEVWETCTCYGQKHEAVCSPRLNSGFFTALHDAGEALATFVGHDHVNDYHGTLHGITLFYGRASGYQTYGRTDMRRGARLIRLREGQRQLESWLRLDDGQAVLAQPAHPPQAPACP